MLKSIIFCFLITILVAQPLLQEALKEYEQENSPGVNLEDDSATRIGEKIFSRNGADCQTYTDSLDNTHTYCVEIIVHSDGVTETIETDDAQGPDTYNQHFGWWHYRNSTGMEVLKKYSNNHEVDGESFSSETHYVSTDGTKISTWLIFDDVKMELNDTMDVTYSSGSKEQWTLLVIPTYVTISNRQYASEWTEQHTEYTLENSDYDTGEYFSTTEADGSCVIQLFFNPGDFQQFSEYKLDIAQRNWEKQTVLRQPSSQYSSYRVLSFESDSDGIIHSSY